MLGLTFYSLISSVHLPDVHYVALETVWTEGVIFNAMLVVVNGLGGVVEETGYLSHVVHAQTDEGDDALLGTERPALAGVAL